jgi:hypothetical protein
VVVGAGAAVVEVEEEEEEEERSLGDVLYEQLAQMQTDAERKKYLRDTYEVYALQELEHIPAAAAVVPLTAGHGTALEARRQRHGVIQFMVCRKTPSLRSAA